MNISSLFSGWQEPLLELKKELDETKERLIGLVVFINESYGCAREGWLQITRAALRALAPFVAAVLISFLFPPLLAKVTLPFAVIGVSFLSAFYGLADPKPVLRELEFDFKSSRRGKY